MVKREKKKKLSRCSKLLQEKRNLRASWMTLVFWNLTLVLAFWKFCGIETVYVNLKCRAVSAGARHGRPVLPHVRTRPRGAASQPQVRMYQGGKQWHLAAACITGQSLLSHSSIWKQEADSPDLSHIPRNLPFCLGAQRK